MKRLVTLLGVGLLCTAAAFATATAQAPTGDSAALQVFDANIKPDDMRSMLKLLAAEPNHVGSPHDKSNAEWILDRFKEWGWDAHIETFEVLYPTPISETLETVGPKPFKAMLQEPPIAGDSSSTAKDPALPAYVAYQGDGDVTAPLVYVNYGMRDDYKTLERLGVSVKGKIVIARYGSGWRGLKPRLAQEHGAIGCIIYSDPADDGYSVDETYPNGPARPPHGIQRGSVQDMTLYPGVRGSAPRKMPGAWRAPMRRRFSKFPHCRFPMPMRRSSWVHSAATLCRRGGAAACRSPITWGPARHSCISRSNPTGVSRRSTTSSR
jgi:N-acetylated-alpha-linked acidic dipeptidase